MLILESSRCKREGTWVIAVGWVKNPSELCCYFQKAFVIYSSS